MVIPQKRRHAHRRHVSTLVMALGTAALLASCGAGHIAAARPGVALLPDAAAAGHAWNWTAGCPFSPSTARACAGSGPDLGHAQLSGDEWNLGPGPTTAGSVRMSVRRTGTLVVRGDLPGAPPCTQSTCLASSANTWVRGYPSVLYGINPCHADTSPPVSRRLPLPMRVGSIPADLVGTTSYSSRTSQVTYDIAYDMWLHPSATKTPCKGDGTLEVMVWTDYNARALLPDSLKVGTATVPFAVDGSAHRGTNSWSVYANNIYGQGHTVPWGGTLWFVLHKAGVTSRGTVSVDLSAVLSAAGSLLETDYGWTGFRSHYWLDTIPFGIEFGPASGTPYDGGSSRFSLDISSYCLAVRTRPAQGAC